MNNIVCLSEIGFNVIIHLIINGKIYHSKGIITKFLNNLDGRPDNA